MSVQITTERLIRLVESLPIELQIKVWYGNLPIACLPEEGGNTRIIFFKNEQESCDAIKFKTEMILKDNMTIQQAFWFISKPMRIEILAAIKQLYDVPTDLYSELLHEIWIQTEFPGQMGIKRICDLFKQATPEHLMKDEDRAVYNKLPDTVKVYRGIQDKKTKVRGCSWTLDREVAMWFSKRWNSKDRAVYVAEIKKKDIFMYTNERNEKEIVVNPRCLKNIKKISPTTVVAAKTGV